MIAKCYPRSAYIPLLAWAMAVGIVTIGGRPIQAQKAEQKPSADATASDEISILNVEHQPVQDLMTTFSNLYAGEPAVNMAVDSTSNRIYVRGKPSQLRLFKDFLRQADVPSATKPIAGAPIVQIYHLQNSIDKTLQDIGQMISKQHDASFATDPIRKLLIVRGDDATYRAVEKVLKQVDVPAPPDEGEVKVRITWIVCHSGPIDAKGWADPAALGTTSPMPDNLKNVATELESLGYIKPRLATQALVTAVLGRDFTTLGTLTLNSEYAWEIHGMVKQPAGPGNDSKIGLSMSAWSQLPADTQGHTTRSTLFNLSTQITAPPGQGVVLGMTPSGTMTSAFVVQVLPSGTARHPPLDGVQGQVLDTDAKNGLVNISIGSDAGLALGNTLEVYRLKPKPEYVGMVTILDTNFHGSVARPITPLRAGPVQKGDTVARRIVAVPR